MIEGWFERGTQWAAGTQGTAPVDRLLARMGWIWSDDCVCAECGPGEYLICVPPDDAPVEEWDLAKFRAALAPQPVSALEEEELFSRLFDGQVPETYQDVRDFVAGATFYQRAKVSSLELEEVVL